MEQEQTADRQVRLEKFRLLHQMLPQSISFGGMLALVTVVMLWRTQQPALLIGWLTAHVLVGWWRFVVLRRFGRLQTDGAAAMRLAPAIQLGCLVSSASKC